MNAAANKTVSLHDMRSVCIVDQHEEMVAALRMLLDGLEAEILVFSDAETYLERVDSGMRAPACLIVELTLPGLSGLDLFETLTARGIAPPTVVLASDERVAFAVRAIRAGVLEYFEKPYIEPRLRHVVRNLLEHGQSH